MSLDDLLLRCYCFILLCVFHTLHASLLFADNRATLPNEIFILHSFHQAPGKAENINKGIADILLAKDRQDIELYIEYMDTLRRPDAAYPLIYRDLAEKYAAKKFVAVIGVDLPAVTFLRQYHSLLFPMTPVLYCGVNCQFSKPDGATEGFIGVCEHVDINATINAGLHLYPATRNIVIINDLTPNGRQHDAAIQKAIKAFGERGISFHVWNSLSIEELLKNAKTLEDTFFVLVNFSRDREGSVLSSCRSAALLAAKSDIPILSMWRYYMDCGILGGKMIDEREQGRTVAKMVVDILMGKPVENFVAGHSTENQLIFDYKQLQRFDIKQKKLPEGSIVTDKPQSVLWKDKKTGLIIFGIALVLEAAVIVLSVVTYKSKKAEQKLEDLVYARTHELSNANEQLKAEIHIRKKIEDALRDSEETLHLLSVNLLTVQENERRRISLELHDELGQSLAALKLQVGALEKKMGYDLVPELQEECNELRESINLIIENVRRLSRDLSPVALDDLGVDAALEYLITNFARLHGIDVSLDLIEINHFFSQAAQRLVYRIVQESLNNVGKHAYATQVTIKIEKIKNRIFLIVKDNGAGFNTETLQSRKKAQRGMGLAAMSERVRILGGEMHIDSKKGEGTTITVNLPV